MCIHTHNNKEIVLRSRARSIMPRSLEEIQIIRVPSLVRWRRRPHFDFDGNATTLQPRRGKGCGRVLLVDCVDVIILNFRETQPAFEMQTPDDSSNVAVEKIVKVRRKAFDEVDFQSSSSQQATTSSNYDAGNGNGSQFRVGPIGPGSPLHRDGEQARIVEEVRRRQKLDHHNDEGYYEWIESNMNVLWQGMGMGGSDHAPRRRPNNPYREINRQTISGMTTAGCSSVSPRRKSGEDVPFKSSSVYKKSRSVRIVYLILHHSMRAWRWLFDTCITRLARLERNVMPYSTTPVYSLEVTADDVLLLAFFIVTMGQYCATVQVVAAPSVAMILISVMFVVWRCEGRQNSLSTRSRGRGESNSMEENSAEAVGLNHEEIEQALVDRLRKRHSITEAECSRFLRCSQYDEIAASQRAEGYMQWRSDCKLDLEIDEREHVPHMNEREFGSLFAEKDNELWNDAAKRAIEIDTNMHGSNLRLPQIICSYEDYFPAETGKCDSDNTGTSNVPRCTDNTRILQIFPARLDLSLAAAHTYSLAAALYLDCRFSRSIEEKVALFVDVRGGF